ncbi:MAG TPA: NDP-sugar synthase [bacterium]|nr:NDP-sugar synthase [bacterium]
MIEIPITIVILAAGKGTRLGALRLAHSKAMTPILGVPVVERVAEAFLRNGCRDFVVVASPDDKALKAWAEEFGKNGSSVRLAFQKERKGTAHALFQARSFIRQDFAVTSCDNLYSDEHISNLLTAHLAHRPPAVITIAGYEQKDLDKAAGVKLTGNMVQEIREKPGRESSGWDAISKFLFTFRKDLLDCLDAVRPSPRGEQELQDAITLFMDMCDEYCRAVKVERFLHLTSVADLIEIHRHYLRRHRPVIIHQEAKVEAGVTMVHPVMIDAGALVQAGATLGPNVYVGKGARIGEGARVEDAVIYAGARIEAGAKIKGEVVAK